MGDTQPNNDLDLTFLNEIADGSDEFIVESIDMFLQQTPALLNDINQGIESQNWAATSSAAHKLKPNLGFFGMHVCQALMQEVETLAKSGMPDVDIINQKFAMAKELMQVNLSKLAQIKIEKQG